MAKSQPVPETRVRAVAGRLTTWLIDRGCVPSGSTPEQASFAYKPSELEPATRTDAALHVLIWLVKSALWAAERTRWQKQARGSAAFKIRPDLATIYFDNDPVELGFSIREILGRIEKFEPRVRHAQENCDRLGAEIVPGYGVTIDVASDYAAFIREGYNLLGKLAPHLREAGDPFTVTLPAPWTLADWKKRARDLQIHLHVHGFTSEEIADFFDSPSAEAITQARHNRKPAQKKYRQAAAST